MRGANMISRKIVLVVEDNLLNRSLLCQILSSEYDTLEAENGQEALDILKQYGERISLILLDIVMPVMDGYTFLSIIKSDAAVASIPVIVTTQKDGESDEVAALSHGAADFVAKPYRPQIILHRVASIINLRETAAMINLVQYDGLTGLYSKAFFYQRVKETLLQHPGQQYDIICSDIENFKLVNDIFGIPAGDRLLCGVAELYTSLVGDRGICGRLNADQFVCLLERRWTFTDDLFVQAIARVNDLSDAKNVVMKWGVYSIIDSTISVEQMCDRALLAVRSIKGQYGKYFAVYDEKLRSKLLREQAITDGMERALAEGQFEIYLQPKYCIQTGVLSGAEALVRWIHPEWGMQSPAYFIPLFERNGFITKLDQCVWDQACALLRAWDDKGYPPFSISVNVSRADIYNVNLADILLKTVQKYQLPPARLHLEITESAYTEDPNQIIDTVNHLRELGFIIEMDDFGSGYSSLNMLNKMPLDVLKLDMNFIQNETAKPVDQGILRFIMALARWMNLSVVAEGVETLEQLERLREVGCDYAQGYLFAKPMPGKELEALLAEAQGQAPACPPVQDRLDAHQDQLIMVIDEDEDYRAQVCQVLRGEYQILEADEAQAAIAYLSAYAERLSGVLLSLTMPDGFTVLETLQREKRLFDIPVIATGTADEHLEARALTSGADDYAAKPHLPASLRKRVLRATGMSAAQERERKLQDAANHDFLTGLLNRRGLEMSAATLRAEDWPMALFLFDLDDLKQINDTHGHAEGDQLIWDFGRLLQAHTRESDILVRYGGDEFIAIMKRMGSEEHAQRKGEEICRAIQEARAVQCTGLSCSVGIVLWKRGATLETVIQRADQALYCAKTSKKGECCLWRG